VRALADSWLAPLAIACALLTVRHRVARWGGMVTFAISLLLYAVGWANGVLTP